MAEVHIKINNQFVTAEEGDTILEAANKSGIQIPTLCYLKNVIRSGACRVCLVEVKGARALLSACTTPVSEGMEVWTNSERAIRGRKTTVELIMSNHNKNCLSCKRNTNCELQRLCAELGIRQIFGSSTGQLLARANGKYALLCTVAFALSVPVSLLLIHQWLQMFVAHAPITVWFFLLAYVILLVLTALVVTVQSALSLRFEPVEVIHNS